MRWKVVKEREMIELEAYHVWGCAIRSGDSDFPWLSCVDFQLFTSGLLGVFATELYALQRRIRKDVGFSSITQIIK
jgi:hypothetical protein